MSYSTVGYKGDSPHSRRVGSWPGGSSHSLAVGTPFTTVKVSMPDNFAALVAAGVFRIVSLTGNEGNHFAGVGSQRADPKPIVLNLPSGTTVWQFLVYVQNARLISSSCSG